MGGNRGNRRKSALERLCTSYDKIAREYSRRSFGELAHKPADCEILDIFIQRAQGIVCDLGCGPGQVARYLADRGREVVGVDVSAGMVAEARRLNPDVTFLQADMRQLPVEDEAWGGIVAFYSLIHVVRKEVPSLLKELHRVLKPGGQLLVSFHLGNTMHRSRDWWGIPVDMDYTSFESDEMQFYVRHAGFTVEGWLVRPPYVTPTYREAPSYRGFVFGQKKGSPVSASEPAAIEPSPGAGN